MMVGPWAFAMVVDPQYGDAPRCPSCGKYISMRPWLPPYRARLKAGTKSSAPGDVITGPGFKGFMASDRFIAEFERAKLTGIERWEPVEIARLPNRVFKLGLLPVAKTRANLREMRPIFSGDPPDCQTCGAATIESYEGVVVDQDSWTGDDIFQFTNLGILMVTEPFVDFITAGKFDGVMLVPAAEFVPSFARKTS
jgi:hypothetical protein